MLSPRAGSSPRLVIQNLTEFFVSLIDSDARLRRHKASIYRGLTKLLSSVYYIYVYKWTLSITYVCRYVSYNGQPCYTPRIYRKGNCLQIYLVFVAISIKSDMSGSSRLQYNRVWILQDLACITRLRRIYSPGLLPLGLDYFSVSGTILDIYIPPPTLITPPLGKTCNSCRKTIQMEKVELEDLILSVHFRMLPYHSHNMISFRRLNQNETWVRLLVCGYSFRVWTFAGYLQESQCQWFMLVESVTTEHEYHNCFRTPAAWNQSGRW